MLVKLHRPPPEIRIFFPMRSARSRTTTLRPRAASFDGAHEPGSSAAKNNRVKFFGPRSTKPCQPANAKSSRQLYMYDKRAQLGLCLCLWGQVG